MPLFDDRLAAEEARARAFTTFAEFLHEGELRGVPPCSASASMLELRAFIDRLDLAHLGLTHGDRLCTALADGPIAAAASS